VPSPPGAGLKLTEPEFSTFEPSSERQAIRSLGRSSVTSASQSTVAPAGALAVQCERPSPDGSTDARWYMKLGRLVKSRQNP
jgi:hypothetical protein